MIYNGAGTNPASEHVYGLVGSAVGTRNEEVKYQYSHDKTQDIHNTLGEEEEAKKEDDLQPLSHGELFDDISEGSIE